MMNKTKDSWCGQCSTRITTVEGWNQEDNGWISHNWGCDDSENSGSFVKNDKLKRERETVCFQIFRSEGWQSNCVFGRNNLCSTHESDTCVQGDDLGLVFISWKMMYIYNVNSSSCYPAISSFVYEKTCFRIDLKCTCIYV